MLSLRMRRSQSKRCASESCGLRRPPLTRSSDLGLGAIDEAQDIAAMHEPEQRCKQSVKDRDIEASEEKECDGRCRARDERAHGGIARRRGGDQPKRDEDKPGAPIKREKRA